MEKIESLRNVIAGQSLHIDDLKKQLAVIELRKVDAQNSHQLHEADIAILRRTRGDLLTDGNSTKDVDKQLSLKQSDLLEIADLLGGLSRRSEAITAEILVTKAELKGTRKNLRDAEIEASYAEYEAMLEPFMAVCTKLVKLTFGGVTGRQQLYAAMPDELRRYQLTENREPKTVWAKRDIQG